MRALAISLILALASCSDETVTLEDGGGVSEDGGQASGDTGQVSNDVGQIPGDGGEATDTGGQQPGDVPQPPECAAEPNPESGPPSPVFAPAFRYATTLGLAGADNIINRTGENPTTATWDGKVIVRRCADPEGVEFIEPPSEGPPGVLAKQYWCFHAFRPSLVTVDADGVPDFSAAFDPGFMSTDRHVSHTGGFPVVENLSPAARYNPYPSTVGGVACGPASLEDPPPPCPEQRYATYDVHIIHSVFLNNPTVLTDYPDFQYEEGVPTYFEQMLIVVQEPETVAARVLDVIRESTPYRMIVDPDGFGFVYDADDPSVRNPYLHRNESDPNTYLGGIVTSEPSATNDGRMVVFNGGDENPYGTNLIYTWNPTPAAQTGWSPPKNVAYMYYVEGPGSPDGETQITIGGVEYAFSDIFPIAREPLRDQEGVLYNPGSIYVPAQLNPDPEAYPYSFDVAVGGGGQYMGAYPWISWDGRHLMSLTVGRFNVAVIGDLTGYSQYWIDGGIDRTDSVGQDAHQISAMWNLGQWPGRWAQYAVEFEGRRRSVPTRLGDAPTWVIFEQDHYSEISFHKTDGSYALYLPMSRMLNRNGRGYKEESTPDVSGRFNTGALVQAGGHVGFSQRFSDSGYETEPLTRVFGFSGNSIGFLADASDQGVEPHISAEAVTGIEIGLTVEAAVYLQTGPDLAATPWTTIVRQPGAFALGVDESQRPWFQVTDSEGSAMRVSTEAPIPEDAWVHLTGVYDGGELRLYVDARLSAAEGGTNQSVRSSTADVAIGPRNDSANPGGDGLVFIDEVGVSPGVRGLDEIAHSAFQRLEWPTASLAEWEQMWGEGGMPLGLVDGEGGPLAPIHLGHEVSGDVDGRIRLGERLFHDGGLSTTTPPISCASCHALTEEDGGARAGEVISTQGAGPMTRHTPTVFNRVFGPRQFWDGRAGSLAEQILFPITSPVEMNMPLDELTDTVLPQTGYREDFCAAFGSNDITVPRMQEAIAFFESGLVSGNSAIDRHRFLGEPLPESVERGWGLFATRARCIGCHAPPLYTDERFHDNAQGNDTDPGRQFFTARPNDFGRFRTMSLRDVDRTPPYMHDGSVPTLQEVVELYNTGGDGTEPEMRPLGLTPEEIGDLTDFLHALRSEDHVIPLR